MKKTLLRRLMSLVGLLFITNVAYSQNQNDTVYQYGDEIQQLLENSEGETNKNYDDELIELHERFTEPLNINTATKEQLQQFSFLSDVQIEHILSYLYLHGEMKTIYELQLVEDMDIQTIRYLSAFFKALPVVHNKFFPTLEELCKKGRSEVLSRVDIPFYRSAGYVDKYRGTPYYHSLRYAYRYRDNVFAGFSAEKDMGETFFASPNKKGYDSYSIYFLVKDAGRLKTLAIGDYRLSFGQGLVVSNDFLIGKTAYITTLNRRGNNIYKHSSTDEQHFFRGAAASVALNKNILLSTFLSYRLLDGTVKEGELTSIHSSGLHRSQKEIDDRNSFGLLFTGGNINYSAEKWQVGATGIYYHFSHPYVPVQKKYNRYTLQGSSFYNVGIDYSYRFNKFSIVGEEAVGRHGVATTNRIRYNLSQDYNIVLFHRYYAHNYWAYFAHTLSESSTVQNENGWFLAVDAKPWHKLSCFAAIDLISFPWCRYRVSKPSQAIDGIFRCSYCPRKTNQMDFYYRYKQKERDVSNTKGSDIRPTYQHSFRYKYCYLPIPTVRLSAITDYRLFRQQGFSMEKGYQLTGSVVYSLRDKPLQCVLQGSYFNVDSYDTKVYIAERSLLYSSYIPSFQGTGIHLSIRFQYKLNTRWLFITHCGHTRYYNQDSIGTGTDKIDSSYRTDMKIQVKYRI